MKTKIKNIAKIAIRILTIVMLVSIAFSILALVTDLEVVRAISRPVFWYSFLAYLIINLILIGKKLNNFFKGLSRWVKTGSPDEEE